MCGAMVDVLFVNGMHFSSKNAHLLNIKIAFLY